MTDDRTMTRRHWLASATGTVIGGAALLALRVERADALGSAAPAITVYKDPSCGCCTKWVAHLTANGYTPIVKDRTDMPALKDSLGVPGKLRACHTAVVGKYVIEGHVPAGDVKRLYATAPKGVLGLAVPEMPAGSPGMEMGGRSDRYDVLAFGADGTTHIFSTHG